MNEKVDFSSFKFGEVVEGILEKFCWFFFFCVRLAEKYEARFSIHKRHIPARRGRRSFFLTSALFLIATGVEVSADANIGYVDKRQWCGGDLASWHEIRGFFLHNHHTDTHYLRGINVILQLFPFLREKKMHERSDQVQILDPSPPLRQIIHRKMFVEEPKQLIIKKLMGFRLEPEMKMRGSIFLAVSLKSNIVVVGKWLISEKESDNKLDQTLRYCVCPVSIFSHQKCGNSQIKKEDHEFVLSPDVCCFAFCD